MQYLKTDVRNRILESAEKEFQQNGYLNASIRTIAENAGISLGNVYRYFSNKEALFSAVLYPIVEEISKNIYTRFFDKGDPLDVADEVVEYLWQNNDKLKIILQANTYYVSGLKTILTEVCSKIIEKLLCWYPEFMSKIQNPYFTTAITAGFLHALNFAVTNDMDKETQKRNVKELVVFFFEKIETRFSDEKQ